MWDKTTSNDHGMDATPFKKATNHHKRSSLSGMPVSPAIGAAPTPGVKPVIIRYMHEGGHIGQGRICLLIPTARKHAEEIIIPVSQVIHTLREDGVDFDLFYACAYESRESTGGWMPLEPAPRDNNPWNDTDANESADDSMLAFKIPHPDDANVSRRIDVKLFRRPSTPFPKDKIQLSNDPLDAENTTGAKRSLATVEHSFDACHAMSASVPVGKIPLDGYFGIGILHPKASPNVGTLWRSAYQLGASVLYTIGGRYKARNADTLNVPARIPLIELDDWSSFAEWAAPKAAAWVAVETGGMPLGKFEHPRNAIYILGSEEHGLPRSVLRGCRNVVSLESELYGSYNVAVAGSIVMYDRMMKMRRKSEERDSAREKKR